MPAYPKNFIEKQSDSAEPKQLLNLLENNVETVCDELASGLQTFIVPQMTPTNIKQATGYIYITTLPQTNDKIGIDKRSMTFVVSRGAAGQITKGADANACAANIKTAFDIDFSGILTTTQKLDGGDSISGVSLLSNVWGTAPNTLGLTYISGSHADIKFSATHMNGGDDGVYGTVGQIERDTNYNYYCTKTGVNGWGRQAISTEFPLF